MKTDLAARLRSHWHGQLSLWLVFFYCPFLILIPSGLATIVGIVGSVVLTAPSPNAGRWLVGATLATTDALAVWWCWGTIQTSFHMLSMNRLIAAAPVFALGFCATLLVISEVLPESYTSTRELVVEFQKERQEQKKAEPSWEKKPWTVTAQPELKRLIATGDIGWGSAKVLERALSVNPNLTLLEIDSLGGLVHEENLIVDIVRNHKMDTLVLNKCASACTGVFLAGERRYVGPIARMGFHQSGFRGRERDTKWSIPEYESAILYRAKGVSEDFMREALNTSYFSLWKPDVLDVKLSGFATNWWSDRPTKYQ